jgi:exodeoxyribonuclease VII large subunit
LTTLRQNARQRDVLAVSELNKQARRLLESHFGQVWVQGELSNVVRAASGHWYFTLKDRNGQLRCAMFKNRNRLLRFKPAEGDQVILRGKLSIYEGRGDYQLITEFMEPAGSGALQLALERLKAQLEAEGLFDIANKQPLPEQAPHIIVISSPKGAAIHDIISVFRRRDPSVKLSLLPVAVQGEESVGQIVDAIDAANRYQAKDCPAPSAILLARGGGSIEDLWSFNSEAVVRAIADSALPLVSAVGHETDTTLADLVADRRAPTPSAAAEMLSQDRSETLQQLESLTQRLGFIQRTQLQMQRNTVEKLSRQLQHPGQRLQHLMQRADDLQFRLQNGWQQKQQKQKLQLKSVQARLQQQHPGNKLSVLKQQLQQQSQRLPGLIQMQLKQKGAEFAQTARLLNSISPLATLDRGYTLSRDEQGQLLRDAEQVSVGQRMETQLAKGKLISEVTKIVE